ncbi:HNH endonuclease [bacterium]|nr:HNH endonuclease [bacterium]NUN46312.1 HNH endonuclease [bacterium]
MEQHHDTIVGEIWKQLRENPTYFISNMGRVKSFNYDKVNGRILKPRISGKGHYVVSFRKYNIKQSVYIHHLVARYFLPPPSPDQKLVFHINGDHTNNQATNLMWGTHKDHLLRSSQKNPRVHYYFFANRASRYDTSKITAADAEDIRKMLKNGVTGRRIAKMYGISEMQVTRIRRFENWNPDKKNVQPLAS